MLGFELPRFRKKKELSSYTRVLATLRHAEPDVVPFDLGETRVSGIHIRAYNEYRKQLGLTRVNPVLQIRYLQLPEIDEQFRDLLEVDIESIDPTTSYFESESIQSPEGLSYTDMWQCGWLMPKEGAYYDINRFPLQNASSVRDVELFSYPSGKDEKLFTGWSRKIISIKKNERFPFLGRTCPGIFEMVQLLRGHEQAFIDFLQNVQIAEALMDKVLEHKIDYYNRAIDILNSNHVEHFIISESDDFGAQNGLLIGEEMYRKFVKTRHQELFSFIKKKSNNRAFIELHSCGSIRKLIPDLIEAGVEILNPVQTTAEDMEPALLKRDFGTEIVFHGGGIDTQHLLPKGSKREIEDGVKRNIDMLALGGGFIFSPIHSIQYDVPFENFIVMLREFRKNA